MADFWTSKTDMPTPARFALAGSTIGDDKGYVYAGYGSDYLQDCDEYSQSGNSWTSKADMSTPARDALAASTIGTDKGYVYAGYNGSYLQDCDEYTAVDTAIIALEYLKAFVEAGASITKHLKSFIDVDWITEFSYLKSQIEAGASITEHLKSFIGIKALVWEQLLSDIRAGKYGFIDLKIDTEVSGYNFTGLRTNIAVRTTKIMGILSPTKIIRINMPNIVKIDNYYFG